MRALPHPQHATVIAYLALCVALGGVSYAAITLPPHSVGSKQIKKRAVTTAKLKKGAVTTAKIKSDAVTGALVQDGSLEAADFGQLPTGPQGLTGSPGPTFADAGLDTGCCASSTPTGAAAPSGSKTVTLPFSARLFVFASVWTSISNCSTDCRLDVGLRVDGVAVPGSIRRLGTVAGAPTPTPYVTGELTPWGITETLVAGNHTIELVRQQLTGTMGGSSFGNQQIGAIAIGG